MSQLKLQSYHGTSSSDLLQKSVLTEERVIFSFFSLELCSLSTKQASLLLTSKICLNLDTDYLSWGFPSDSNGKEFACTAGDSGSIPGSRRSPGEGNGNPLQYSCLENSMERGAWWATVNGVAKNWTRLSD